MSAHPLCFSGHSLGGALAILTASDLKRAFPAAEVSVYTFGSPRASMLCFALICN